MAKAKARDVPNVYVVARYKPAGNVVNQFQMNVKPKPQWNPTIIRQTSFSFCEKGRFMNVKSIQIKKSRIFWFSPFSLLFSWSKYQKHLSDKVHNLRNERILICKQSCQVCVISYMLDCLHVGDLWGHRYGDRKPTEKSVIKFFFFQKSDLIMLTQRTHKKDLKKRRPHL